MIEEFELRLICPRCNSLGSMFVIGDVRNGFMVICPCSFPLPSFYVFGVVLVVRSKG